MSTQFLKTDEDFFPTDTKPKKPRAERKARDMERLIKAIEDLVQEQRHFNNTLYKGLEVLMYGGSRYRRNPWE